jgi:hypothetical protein
MKFVFVCLALLAVFIASEGYEYSPPDVPCKWGVEVETTTVYNHKKVKYWVFGRYMKSEVYSHNNDLVSAVVTRPDILADGAFVFNGYSCDVTYGYSPDGATLATVMEDFCRNDYNEEYGCLGRTYDSLDFDFVEESGNNLVYMNGKSTEFDPDRPWIEVRYVPDRSNLWYVDKDSGLLVATVKNDDVWEEREIKNYTYHGASKVYLSDFTLSKRDTYRCPDERIFHNPDAYWAQCGASVTDAIFVLVLASVLAAMALAF